MTKLDQILAGSLNASLAAIMERIENLDERLRNVEDGLMLVMNKPEPKAKAKKETKEK